LNNLVLITGATGWLGKRLVRAVSEGLPDYPSPEGTPKVNLRLLVEPSEFESARKIFPDLEVIAADVSDRETLKTFFIDAEGATLFNCAGIIHPHRVKDFYNVNTKGAENLLELAIAGKLKRFVHVSSNSPIGTNPTTTKLFDESTPYNPYLNYGKSKMLAELFIQERGGKSDLETVIVRPPWFYGIGQPPRQTLFFTMIRNGRAPLVGSGANIRSMAYIDNLCHGLQLCGSKPEASGNIYWIADARPYTMAEIIDTTESVMEKDFGVKVTHKRMRLPDIASEIAYAIDFSLQNIGLYHQKIHVLSEMNKSIACSVEKAKRELGYNPKIDLREGMRRSLSWLNENQIAW
jgi:nucleoside-diphosphate-sugar epimerase